MLDTARAMSQENVKVVKRCMRFWYDRDWSPAPELFDPDVEFDLSRNVFNPDIYRGISDLQRLVSAVDEAWDDFRIDTDAVIDAGDNVVTAVTVKGKGPGSGVDVSMRIFQVWTLRDSKVVRVVGGYRDRAEALEAAGLSEQDAHAGS
jgi:ketosteroid isomerase-like protein